MNKLKIDRYIRRKKRVRAKITGTGKRPRLSIFRSNKSLYAQVIDDEKGVTLAAAKGAKNAGEKVGEELAKKAAAKKVKSVVFDRNGFKFHGRVKALAEGARKGGLEF
jgi:large subunit ribosomal protein L18